jgi:hypothetical protein
MHWISLLPKAFMPHPPDPAREADTHAAEARDCAIAMAAYLPPGGGIVAGGCFVQLLDLMDDAAEAPTEGHAAEAGELPPPHAANPGETRH